MKACTFLQQNNHVILELFKRHGKDINFVGQIIGRGHFDDFLMKERTGQYASKLAFLLDAQAALLTIEGTGAAVGSVADAVVTGLAFVFVHRSVATIRAEFTLRRAPVVGTGVVVFAEVAPFGAGLNLPITAVGRIDATGRAGIGALFGVGGDVDAVVAGLRSIDGAVAAELTRSALDAGAVGGVFCRDVVVAVRMSPESNSRSWRGPSTRPMIGSSSTYSLTTSWSPPMSFSPAAASRKALV